MILTVMFPSAPADGTRARSAKETSMPVRKKSAIYILVAKPLYIIGDGLITLKDFERFDLRVATILSAEDIPNSDRLYLLKVSLGSEERNIVAGIKGHYRPDELIGKRIIVLSNLEPATIRGVRSRGMLLAADDGKGMISLLTVDREIGEGSRVR